MKLQSLENMNDDSDAGDEVRGAIADDLRIKNLGRT